MNLPIQSIFEKDKKTFLLLASMICIIFVTIITGENAVEALLINKMGAAILPKMYLINAFFLFFVSFIFLHIIDRVDRGRFFYTASLFFAGIILLSRFFIALDVTWIYPFLYIFSYTTKTVLFIIFWTVANDICDTREAKEIFPLIAGAGILGNTFASIATGVFVKNLHTENLLFIWAGLLFIGIFVFRFISKEFPQSLKVTDSFKGIQRTAIELKDDFSAVNKEPLLQIMAVIFFLTFVFLFNIDFLFYHTAGETFTQVDDLTRFLGFFKAGYSIVTFILQFFVISFFFNKYGISNSMIIVPIVFIGIALMLLTTLGFTNNLLIPIVIGTFLRFVIFEVVFSPTYQIFFSSVRKSMRGKGKAFIEGIVKPIAIGCAGLTIILLAPHAQIVLFLFLLSIASILLYATSKLKNWYTETLIKTVGGVHYDDFRPALESFYKKLDKDILPFLQESLNKEQDINVKLFIIEIIGQIQGEESNTILHNAFNNKEFTDRRIHASILISMMQLNIKKNLSFFITQLDNHDHRVRANAIEAITKLQERNIYPLIEHACHNDTHPRVRANALISLWQLTNEHAKREDIRQNLTTLLANDDPQEISRALFILGAIKDISLMDIIAQHIIHTNVSVRQSAITALAGYNTTHSHRLLINALYELSDDADLNAITSSFADVGGSAVHVIMEHIRTDNKRICAILLTTTHHILKANSHENQMVILGFAERDKLEAIALAELEHIYRHSFIVHTLQHSSNETLSFLAQAIREKIDVSITIILEILGILDTSGKIAAVTQRIKDADDHVQADVFEILENIGHTEIVSNFLPLIEVKNKEKMISIGKRTYNLTFQPLTETIIDILSDPDTWLVAVAINAVANTRELIDNKKIIRLLRERTASKHPLLRELSARALKQKSRTIIKSIAAKGAKSMLSRDLLKEKFTIVERVIFLKKIPLFKTLDSERLKLFAEIATEETYRANDVIIREDDIGEFIYIIKTGSVNIIKNIGQEETIISTIPEQTLFGEMGLIDNQPRSASCVANTHSSILVIRKTDFLNVLHRSPELAVELFKVFTQRIREGNEKIRKLTQEKIS